MALELRDPNTGQIKIWVWAAGAAAVVGGAALFLSSGSTNAGSIEGEGLGDQDQLDALNAALQDLLDKTDSIDPNPPGTIPPAGGGGSGTGSIFNQVFKGGHPTGVGLGTSSGRTPPSTGTVGGSTRTISGVPSASGKPAPSTGGITNVAPTASGGFRAGAIGGTTTGRTTAVSTGSINPYPISKQVNQPHQVGSTTSRPNPWFADL